MLTFLVILLGFIPRHFSVLTESGFCGVFGQNNIHVLSGSFDCTSNNPMCSNSVSSLGSNAICTGDEVTQIIISKSTIMGFLPFSLSELTAVTYLDLSNNKYSGPIPDEYGSQVELQYLALGLNYLTGTIPASLGNLVHISGVFDIGVNSLKGTIPESLGQLTGAQEVFLDSNSLEGKIPESFGGLINCQVLLLDTNLLTGPIPQTFEKLRSLRTLALAMNHLNGNIPSYLGTFSSLSELHLEGNMFSGTIPDTFGLSPALSIITMGDNDLSGSIPSSLCRLPNLSTLHVGSNPKLTCYAACLTSVMSTDFTSTLAKCSGINPVTSPVAAPTSPVMSPVASPTVSTPQSSSGGDPYASISSWSAHQAAYVAETPQSANLGGAAGVVEQHSIASNQVTVPAPPGGIITGGGGKDPIAPKAQDTVAPGPSVPGPVTQDPKAKDRPAGPSDPKTQTAPKDPQAANAKTAPGPPAILITDTDPKVKPGPPSEPDSSEPVVSSSATEKALPPIPLKAAIDLDPFGLDCYSTCVLKSNPTLKINDWTESDFCSFYEKSECPANVIAAYDVESDEYPNCPPSCLESCPSVFCETFSYLSLGCPGVMGFSEGDALYLKKQCLESYAKSSASATRLSFTLSITLQVLELPAVKGNIIAEQLLSEVLADALTIEPKMVKVKSVLAHGLRKRRGLLAGAATAVTFAIEFMTESFGYTADQSQVLYTKITDSFRESVSSGDFIEAIVAKARTRRQPGLSKVEEISFSYPSEPDIAIIKTAAPTFEPTTLPTYVPTSSRPTTKPTKSPIYVKGCPLEVTLLDKFGDGWGSDAFFTATYSEYIDGPGNNGYGFNVPPKSLDASTGRIVIAPDAHSLLTVSTWNDVPPPAFWEIYWSVTVEGITYVGDYGSKITVHCDWKSETSYSLSVFNTKDLPEGDCDRCSHPSYVPPDVNSPVSGSSKTAPNVGPAYVKSNPAAPTAPTTTLSVATAVSSPGRPDVSSAATLISKNSPKRALSTPTPYAVLLTLLNEKGTGWYNGLMTSTYYAISNPEKTKLYAMETVCGQFSKESCEEDLQDGYYVFRVGGNGDRSRKDYSWKFCGMRGGPKTEMLFTMYKGKCIPGEVISSDVSVVSEPPPPPPAKNDDPRGPADSRSDLKDVSGKNAINSALGKSKPWKKSTDLDKLDGIGGSDDDLGYGVYDNSTDADDDATDTISIDQQTFSSSPSNMSEPQETSSGFLYTGILAFIWIAVILIALVVAVQYTQVYSRPPIFKYIPTKIEDFSEDYNDENRYIQSEKSSVAGDTIPSSDDSDNTSERSIGNAFKFNISGKSKESVSADLSPTDIESLIETSSSSPPRTTKIDTGVDEESMLANMLSQADVPNESPLYGLEDLSEDIEEDDPVFDVYRYLQESYNITALSTIVEESESDLASSSKGLESGLVPGNKL